MFDNFASDSAVLRGSGALPSRYAVSGRGLPAESLVFVVRRPPGMPRRVPVTDGKSICGRKSGVRDAIKTRDKRRAAQ